MQDERSPSELAGSLGAGPTLLAAFGRTEDAAAALEQEVEGGRTVLVVDAGPRENQARQILAAHGGLEFDPPG